MIGRTAARKAFDTSTRISLLEDDTDRIEDTVGSIRTMMQRVVYSLVTATITFGVSAILLSLNLVVNR